ncbi:hypothetical protein [Penaeicola halotolerans]|uniref:hypothetical protein n=1 Tax=Penaeicola halotolerans TaxID=2793196 RepID=UPI001CF91D53|nr:hypothetical protein [Penaeicola halotolerans]
MKTENLKITATQTALLTLAFSGSASLLLILFPNFRVSEIYWIAFTIIYPVISSAFIKVWNDKRKLPLYRLFITQSLIAYTLASFICFGFVSIFLFAPIILVSLLYYDHLKTEHITYS